MNLPNEIAVTNIKQNSNSVTFTLPIPNQRRKTMQDELKYQAGAEDMGESNTNESILNNPDTEESKIVLDQEEDSPDDVELDDDEEDYEESKDEDWRNV